MRHVKALAYFIAGICMVVSGIYLANYAGRVGTLESWHIVRWYLFMIGSTGSMLAGVMFAMKALRG